MKGAPLLFSRIFLSASAFFIFIFFGGTYDTFSHYSIYYQFLAKHLAMCPLTLHMLIHIPYNIQKNGPPCNNWMFVMEWWCGSLLPAIKSWKEPFMSLTLWQYQAAQLFEIVNRFNLTDLMPTIVN